MIYKWIPKPLKKYYQRLYWRMFYNYIGIMGRLKPARFLNHGYAEEGVNIKNISIADLVKLAQNLYLHLFQQAPPEGKTVMEIGCGRGSGLALLNEHYKPQRSVGVDLSDANIKIARRNCKAYPVEFIRGNAEKQIFPDKTFDVVYNLESSHCYPSRRKFFENVFAVLKDDGSFVYSDAFWHTTVEALETELNEVGFSIEKKEDITKEVFRSIEIKSFIKKAYMQKTVKADNIMNNFVAGPGSEMYEYFKAGSLKYLLYVLKKRKD